MAMLVIIIYNVPILVLLCYSESFPVFFTYLLSLGSSKRFHQSTVGFY